MARPGPVAVVAALVPAAVLAVDPGGLAPFGPVKWLVVPTLAVAGLGWLAADRPLRWARGPMRAWAAFLAIAAVAAATGLDPVYAWIGTPERHLGVLAWAVMAIAFVAGQSLERREGRTVALAATVTVGGLGLWVVAEALGWEPFDLAGAGDRPVGTVGSSAYLGAVAALLTPVAVGLAADATGSTRVRRLALVAAALGGVALVVAGARAAWLGAILAAAAVVVSVPAARRRVAVLAVAAVALAVVTGVAGRVPDAVTDDRGGLGGRLDEWRVATRVVADHPVLGAGPEGYRIAFGSAVDDAYEEEHGRTPLPDRAHSAPLDVAATTGLVGLAAWLAVLALTGRHLLPALRREPWLAGMAAGVLAYAGQSLFLFPIAELDPVAWLLAGVVVGRIATTSPRWSPAAVPAAAAVLAVVLTVAGGLDVVADRRARAILAGTGDDPAAAAELRPDAVRYRLAAARAFAAVGSSIGLDRALAQLDAALDVSPLDPVARVERVRLLVTKAQRTGTDRHARQALRAAEDLAHDDPRNRQVEALVEAVHQLVGTG